jgi:L-amino acid N-acyltransferase YncA
MVVVPPVIRDAREGDLEGVEAIYRPEVLEGTASFELEPPDCAELEARWRAIRAAGLPYVVAELDGRIAGYAYAALYRSRPGYRYTCEDSVYIARFARRRGLGQALLERVIAGASARGMRQMVAIIGDSAHLASIRLHEQVGFELVATLQNVGCKFGRWLDTVIMQRPLGEGATSIPAQTSRSGSERPPS